MSSAGTVGDDVPSAGTGRGNDSSAQIAGDDVPSAGTVENDVSSAGTVFR